MDYDLITQIFTKQITKMGINTVLLDFDKTILNIHAYNLLMTQFNGSIDNFIEGRDLSNDFADQILFKKLIHNLQSNNINVHIVSFGSNELINEYMKWVDVQAKIETIKENLAGKNPLIQKIIIDNNLVPEQVLFIDDDVRNINLAIQGGCIYSYHVGIFGLNLQEFITLIKTLLGKSPNLLINASNYSKFMNIDRNETCTLLENKKPGDYIIRPSYSQPFDVAISYIHANGSIIHSLMLHDIPIETQIDWISH